MSDYYAYIFVRQDISQEQQLIQFGHVACVLGRNLPDNVDPHKLNFVGIGVPNEDELWKISDKMMINNIMHHTFSEPDIGSELTGLATTPIRGEERNFFKNYSTLRFSPEA